MARRDDHIHGEDALSDVSDLTLIMDNGTEYAFNIESEIGIADDMDAILKDHRNGAARQAFWSAMAERSLLAVKTQEVNLAQMEGDATKAIRKVLESRQEEWVAESSVQAGISRDRDITTQRRVLNDLRYQYGLIRSVKEAVDRRNVVLNRIVETVLPRGG